MKMNFTNGISDWLTRKKNYQTVLICSILFLFSINSAIAQKKKGKPRNVIFILSDDHRYDYMGFTGKVPWLKTPNMDRMAKEGVHFANAFVTTSLCSPSRASILTGLYSHKHKVVDNRSPDPGNLSFFPEHLQKNGYQTAFLGKWHMGGGDDEPRPGFDHWESFKGQGIYYNPTLNIDSKRIEYKDSTYVTDLLTEHSIDWLEKRDKKKPFFLYLSHKGVHGDFYPAKRHKGIYAGEKLPIPDTYYQTLTGEWQTLKWPEWVHNQRVSYHGVNYFLHDRLSSNLDPIVQAYCETLQGIDDSIGSIMQYLKEEGLDDSTLVIYMGDNGWSFGEHGLMDKRHFYEESVRVPLLARCPDIIKGGTEVHKMVQNIDIAPSVLEVARISKPEQMDGMSFIPLLNGNTKGWRNKIFYEYFWENDYPMTPSMFGVRTDTTKYIRYYGIWDRNEFYNLKDDPEEIYNLIEEEKLQSTIKQNVLELDGWLMETNGMQIPLKETKHYRSGDYKHKKQY